VRSRLARSVSDRLLSDMPARVLWSRGLDSTTLPALVGGKAPETVGVHNRSMAPLEVENRQPGVRKIVTSVVADPQALVAGPAVAQTFERDDERRARDAAPASDIDDVAHQAESGQRKRTAFTERHRHHHLLDVG
jgi:asparagine synthetase B (glutamine-hydrolysing)